MIFIAGKTCSGKTRIVSELCKKFGYKKIVTYTTRPIRNKEVDGIDYHFISEEEFEKKIEEGFFSEYKVYDAEFGRCHYGVATEDVVNAGPKDLLIVTPAGYKDITENYSVQHKLLYIYANNSTIKKRLKDRGDDDNEAERRVKTDNDDFKGFETVADRICYNNYNDDLDQTLNYINEYLEDHV